MDIAWHLYYKILSFFNNPQFLQSFFDNRFYLILLVVVLMRFKYTTYRSMWMSALVNIPGTFLHELMHFLVGALFNAKPCNFTLFPKKNENGDYVMGSVGFRNIAYYNAIPAAMAPFCCCLSAFTSIGTCCRLCSRRLQTMSCMFCCRRLLSKTPFHLRLILRWLACIFAALSCIWLSEFYSCCIFNYLRSNVLTISSVTFLASP